MSTLQEREPAGRRLSRRQAIVAGAAVAALGAAATAEAASGTTYPTLRIIDLAKLKRNRPVNFAYPLEGQPNVLIDFGHAVPHGVGSSKGIVAYSTLCQHMGCGVVYQSELREFVCPCHQSRYDPEREGSIIQGVTPRALPRVLLKVQKGAVWAVGVDGLIYGYRNNLRPGQRAASVTPRTPRRQTRRAEPPVTG
jgi:arsenite oxidase small subunit